MHLQASQSALKNGELTTDRDGSHVIDKNSVETKEFVSRKKFFSCAEGIYIDGGKHFNYDNKDEFSGKFITKELSFRKSLRCGETWRVLPN